jgi:hypothetical protein
MQMASERFAAAAWFLTTSPMPIVQSGAPVEFLAKWYVSPSSVYQNCWHPLTCPVKISLPPTELSLQYPDVAAKGSLEEKLNQSLSLFRISRSCSILASGLTDAGGTCSWGRAAARHPQRPYLARKHIISVAGCDPGLASV